MEGGTCSHPCDQQLYDANRLRVAGNASTTTRRRLDTDKQQHVEMADDVSRSRLVKDGAAYAIIAANEILDTIILSKISNNA
jgi:hypothetical protein